MNEVFILTIDTPGRDGETYVMASNNLENIVLQMLKCQDYTHHIRVVEEGFQDEIDFIKWKEG